MEIALDSSIHTSREVWRAEIKGWSITDCAVRSRTLLYFCLRKELPEAQASRMFDHDIPTKMLVINLEKPGTSFGARHLIGYNKPRIGVALNPLPQGLVVARNDDGQVSVVGGGKDFPDEFIDPGHVPMTWKIKTIDGYAYSVGGQRKIYKRTDTGKWQKVADLPRVEHIERAGFRDLDAFSASDMYAVGGHGDVWHFDGKAWTQMGFPSNVQLATVTCAGDGNVYISGEGGSLWVGQKSTWKNIYKGSSSIPWNDVAWFDERLWLASDYQFRIWNGSELAPVTHEGEQVGAGGHMDVRDGLLAIASPTQAWTFDGRRWRTIIGPYFD
jgi:hypothetical protein